MPGYVAAFLHGTILSGSTLYGTSAQGGVGYWTGTSYACGVAYDVSCPSPRVRRRRAGAAVPTEISAGDAAERQQRTGPQEGHCVRAGLERRSRSVDFYGRAGGGRPERTCSLDLHGTPGAGGVTTATFPTTRRRLRRRVPVLWHGRARAALQSDDRGGGGRNRPLRGTSRATTTRNTVSSSKSRGASRQRGRNVRSHSSVEIRNRSRRRADPF